MKHKKQERRETRIPLKSGEKQVLFATLCRQPAAFVSARPLVSYAQIAEHDRMFAIVWQVVCDYYDEHDELPEDHYLRAGIQRFLGEDPAALSPPELSSLAGFLTFMYSVDLDKLKARVSLKYLQKYLEDRLVDQVRSTLSGYTPVNVRELFASAVTRTDELATVSMIDLAKPFFDDWLDDNAHLELRDTGISFINDFTGDDDRAGFGHGCTESFGLLGPYGGGKTTTAVMLSVRGAAIAHKAWELSGREEPLLLSYHFSWEEPMPSLRIRALSHLAEIPRKRLVIAIRGQDLSANLSHSDSLRDYERQKYAHKIRSGESVPGEYERVLCAMRTLNDCWRVIDLTGHDKESGHTGTGLVDEVASIIRQDQQRSRDYTTGVQVVVTDYVGAAVERNIDARGLDHGDNLRHLINRWPLHMKNKVAIPFFCPTWSIHQLSTTANTLSPGTQPKATDAAEGRAFAENLDACFMFGTRTKDNRMICTCSKQRREASRAATVVHLDGEFQTVRDDSANYVLLSRKIVRVDEARSVQGGNEPDVPSAGAALPDSPSEVEHQNRQLVRPRMRTGQRTP